MGLNLPAIVSIRTLSPVRLRPAFFSGFLSVVLAVVGSSPSHAQEVPRSPAATITNPDTGITDSPGQVQSFDSESRIGSIARTIGKDEWHFIKAPFHKSAIKWDVLVVGATAAFVANDHDESILHDVPIGWHQTSRHISNYTLFATGGIPTGIYFAGLITKSEHGQEVGLRTAEATVDSVLMYGLLKVITQRQRPYSGEGEGKFFAGNWKNGSFPSGHSMLAWTLASSVAHEYHSVPLDLLLYGLAGTVSTTRVTAGQHFPSDVLVGSVFGYLIGDYVAHKQEDGFPIRRGSKLSNVSYAILQHVNIEIQ